MRARISGAGFAVALAATVLGAPGARAQHVVTEAEASKLTLEALTAVPPPPRPIYRAYYRPAMNVRYVRARGGERARFVAASRHSTAWHPASWHLAAWHPAASHPALHHRRYR